MATAVKNPIDAEELIRFSHRISATHGAVAPDSWIQGDTRRPYPNKEEIRRGYLGYLDDSGNFQPALWDAVAATAAAAATAACSALNQGTAPATHRSGNLNQQSNSNSTSSLEAALFTANVNLPGVNVVSSPASTGASSHHHQHHHYHNQQLQHQSHQLSTGSSSNSPIVGPPSTSLASILSTPGLLGLSVTSTSVPATHRSPAAAITARTPPQSQTSPVGVLTGQRSGFPSSAVPVSTLSGETSLSRSPLYASSTGASTYRGVVPGVAVSGSTSGLSPGHATVPGQLTGSLVRKRSKRESMGPLGHSDRSQLATLPPIPPPGHPQSHTHFHQSSLFTAPDLPSHLAVSNTNFGLSTRHDGSHLPNPASGEVDTMSTDSSSDSSSGDDWPDSRHPSAPKHSGPGIGR